MRFVVLVGAGLIVAAVFASQPPRRDWLRGVNVVWGVSGGQGGIDYQGKAKVLVQRMKEAGVNITRIGISWADIERERGHYHWAETDRLVNFLKAQGFDLLACFCTTPPWASAVGRSVVELFSKRKCAHLLGVLPPAHDYWQDYERYCKAVAQHFKGRVWLYEFWNEPDGMGMPLPVYDSSGEAVDIRWGGDPELYAKLLRITYRGLKSGDPHCLVAIGGLDGRPRLDFIEGVYRAGGGRYFDAVCLHPYPFGTRELAWGWVDAVRDVMVRHGDASKPIWITEYGWNATGGDGISEDEQAQLVAESILAMKQRPFIQMATYHTLNDWRTNEADPASIIRMGLCDYDGNPKPAFSAFRSALDQPATVNQLRNPGFEREGSTPGVAESWQNTDGQAHPDWYAIDTRVRHGGRASQRITFGHGARPDLTVWQMTPAGSVYGGRTYAASVWCKAEGVRDNWGGLRLAVRFFAADGTMTQEFRAPLDPSGTTGWHKVSVTADAPKSSIRAQVVLYLHAESGTVWYDDAEFRLVR
ncbi:MAG: beta-galactosidase [Armatimonadetes bacterium]|nr:beta-galactosidase [Armatimonadota bacterium]